jgi:hypothetical protein
MNMASIDSNSEFASGSITASASNTLNNKNNRKLKRVQDKDQAPPVAFIEDNSFL